MRMFVSVRMFFAALSLFILAGCNGSPIRTPAADAPRLESVGIVGQRVCGAFTNDAQSYNFSCDPLPTSVGTGWLLTPLRKPHPTNPNWSNVNRGVVLTVSTPSITSIEVAYFSARGTRLIVLNQVAPGPGRPLQLVQGQAGEVEVVATDDGTRKTWKISIQYGSCLPQLELQVVNISASGQRSGPLAIHLLRKTDETLCVGTPATGGGATVGTFASAPGGSSMGPGGTPSSGQCPGGGSGTFFQFCELCPRGAPRSLAQYTGLVACSLTDAKAIMGYGPGSTKSTLCSLSQVSSEPACEGP